ncbi:CBO0543 family protein [Neobacillus sp. DY30]|uniref:CBO0543 family protein n=1 Tax=Neobacillus sp. DY30 TaxID=3047871 RepID=UPI0024BF9F95|nr:CBO0543 family protein [Neobacillus sp. DY30]WHY00278.1 CBO0543 family protein [Neobacillus sp. DY30]
MGKKFERKMLRLLFLVGIASFIKLVRKPPVKDWFIIFLLKSYIASFLDNILVKKGYLKYPVNLFKTFDISVLFSYLLFPVSCIYFNQVTRNSSILGIILKSILFSAPSTLAEDWIEKNTKLIVYKKSWTSLHSFFSIASTFILVRYLMSLIRKFAAKQSGY